MSSSFDPFAIIRQQQEENRFRTQVLDLRDVAEHPSNDFPMDQSEIEKLAESIDKSGGVLQFPLVRLLNDGTYQMLAGHRRRMASILLGETVDEKYFRCMCYVLESLSDDRAELYLIETNIQARNLSPKFRARKVADARRLIELLKERGELKVRSVKKAVAEHTGVSESTVILQTRIATKLDKDLLELYDQGKITMRDAYGYAGLSAESQEKILEAYLNDLDKDELQKEITRITVQEKLKLGEPSPKEKDATRKINQAHRSLKSIYSLKEEGVPLDRDALLSLRELLDDLLVD